MNRLILWFAICMALFCVAVSCSIGGSGDDRGVSYTVKGTVMLDSAWVKDGDKLVLFSDNHRALSQDTIILSNEGTFEYEGHTNGVDELYLCGEQGELCRFYVSGNMEVNLSIVSAGDQNVKVSYLGQQKDTINGWLDEHRKLFDGQPQKTCRLIMDSLIRNHQSDIRATLLLRDQIFCLNDSLFVRQTLGSIKDEAKPEWMKKSIDNSLKVLGSGKNNVTRRLIGASFEAQDTLIDLSASRSDYLLICFWADYSRPSIDSMQALSKLIASKYEQKRVSFLSCCLNSSDSAMWSIRTRFLNGNHTWIKGGFSDSRMRAWDIKEVPSVILLDMYCNQTKRNVWGEELYKALDRLPNRTGFQK